MAFKCPHTCLALAAGFLLLAVCAGAAGPTVCDKQWLKSKAPSMAGCLLSPKGVGPCLASLFKEIKAVDCMLSIKKHVPVVKDFKWPELRTTLDIPGYLPEQVWPYYRNISSYPLWTENVRPACASKGCNPAFPKPGDGLNVQVQVFPGTIVPRAFIPGPVVMEVRDGTSCVGLPGRCKNPQLDPPYRIAWGPKYLAAAGLHLWGYEHYFDLYPMKDGSGKTIGTTISHHEFYTGILAPVLMPPPPKGLGLSNLYRKTLEQQNIDMRRFITTTPRL